MRNERLGSAGIVERWYKAFAITEASDRKPKLVISLRMRVVGTFASKFQLACFPFDRQELTVAIRSHHPAHTIHLSMPRNLLKYPSICRLDNFVHDDEWMLGKRVLAYETRSYTTDTLSVPPQIYASYHFKIKIARKWTGYAWDIIVPISCLSLFSTTSLFVPRTSLGERIAITLSMVLASLAFRSTFMQRIPVVSFLTTMDKIIIINFFLLGALLVADIAFLFLDSADAAWLPTDVEIAEAKLHLVPHLEFYLACGFFAFQFCSIATVGVIFFTASAANKHWLATKPQELCRQEMAKAEDVAKSVLYRWRRRSCQPATSSGSRWLKKARSGQTIVAPVPEET